jgi:hypothetical protein
LIAYVAICATSLVALAFTTLVILSAGVIRG